MMKIFSKNGVEEVYKEIERYNSPTIMYYVGIKEDGKGVLFRTLEEHDSTKVYAGRIYNVREEEREVSVLLVKEDDDGEKLKKEGLNAAKDQIERFLSQGEDKIFKRIGGKWHIRWS